MREMKNYPKNTVKFMIAINYQLKFELKLLIPEWLVEI